MLDVCQNMPDNLSEAAQPEAIDRVISTGERLAARIVAALLRQNNLRGVAIDATDVIITDDVFGNATPILPLTRERIATHLLPLLNRGIIPVITGFIGATAERQDHHARTRRQRLHRLDCRRVQRRAGSLGLDGRRRHDDRRPARNPRCARDPDALLRRSGGDGVFRRAHPALAHDPAAARPAASRCACATSSSRSSRARSSTPATTPTGFKAVTTIQGLGLSAPHSGPLSAIAALVDEKLSQHHRQPHRRDDLVAVVLAELRLLRHPHQRRTGRAPQPAKRAGSAARTDGATTDAGRCARSPSSRDRLAAGRRSPADRQLCRRWRASAFWRWRRDPRIPTSRWWSRPEDTDAAVDRIHEPDPQ